MTKQLKEKAIKFKGKDYVLIADRVNYFNETYPKGSITTELLSQPDSDMVVVRATVLTGEGQTFTGMSQAKWSDTSSFVNKTSALENAETSSVGRALGFMGIGVIESIASIDEINKTTYSKPYNAPKTDSTLGDCPLCHSPLVEKILGGKKAIKCSAGGWDWKNKKATGCTYIRWITEPGDEVKEQYSEEPSKTYEFSSDEVLDF